jgi:hypothetical protein
MLQELIKEIPDEVEDGPHLILKDMPANHAAFAMMDWGPTIPKKGTSCAARCRGVLS